MQIAMANDHAGYQLKMQIKAWLEEQGHTVVDFGTHDEGSCDLSDFVCPAARAVSRGECERAILVDGVGYGSAMIANKYRNIFACVCQDPVCAELARQHNDANVLCLGGDGDRPAHGREVRPPSRQGLRDRRGAHDRGRVGRSAYASNGEGRADARPSPLCGDPGGRRCPPALALPRHRPCVLVGVEQLLGPL